MDDMTADQAKEMEFTASRRGFDTAQVLAFQAEAAAALRHLEATVARLTAELAESREGEEAVRRTYAAAVREKDEIVSEAKVSADAAGEAARQEAVDIVTAAHAEATAILEESLRRSNDAAAEVAADKAKLIKNYNRVRTATNDLYRRLQAVAGNSLDDLAVISGLIELEDGAAEDLGELETPSTLSDVAMEPDEEVLDPEATDPELDRKTTRYERRLGGLKQRLRDAKES
ncbi:MAG: hypothetical protein HKO87_08080 [Acidimicrobiia bacterium]|nr:hypothetical protein [Acidimicrobiia bacterium]